MIAPNVILIWPGTHAGIPAGFTRETTLDDKYPKCQGTEAPNNTGGALTHSHTSTTHGHTMTAHSHDVILATYSGPQQSSANSPSDVADNHGHNSGSIGGATGGSLQNTAATWATINHEPPYYTVIYIKSSGYNFVPTSAIGLLNTATVPTGYATCDSAGGTPDLRGKYLKGATTGANAGTTGGASTHAHDLGHAHTANTHTHSGASGQRDNSNNRESGTDRQGNTGAHTHTVTLNAATANVSNYVNTTAGNTDTVEPPYYMILAIQNTSGAAAMPPVGLIGLWLGTLATIPAGWFLCDGSHGTPNLTDRFPKIVNTSGDLGSTAGSTTHSHATVNHTHIAVGTHNHSGTSAASGSTHGTQGNSAGYAPYDHTHTLTSVSSVTATFPNSSIDCQTVDNQPPYRTVAYIQFQYGAGGATMMALL